MILSPARLLTASLLLAACGPTIGNGASADVADAPAALSNTVPEIAAPESAGNAAPAAAPTEATGPADTRTREHATIVAELRRQLVGGDATLDGARVTDVQQVDACHTRFSTAKGAVVIEWAKAGNIAPHDQNGREINDLPAVDGPHVLSVRAGDTADGISGAVGLLAGECAG